MAKKSKDGLLPADDYAAKKLHHLRICAGLSQQALAKRVKLTFQQIQKYERGENRMTVGRIAQFAEIFEQPPAVFFSDELNAQSNAEDLPASGLRLMRLFARVPMESRHVVLSVAESLVDKDTPEEAACLS